MSTTPPTTPPPPLPFPPTFTSTPLTTSASASMPYPPLPGTPSPPISFTPVQPPSHSLFQSTPQPEPSPTTVVSNDLSKSSPTSSSSSTSSASVMRSPSVAAGSLPLKKGPPDTPQIPIPIQPLGAPRQDRPRSPPRRSPRHFDSHPHPHTHSQSQQQSQPQHQQSIDLPLRLSNPRPSSSQPVSNPEQSPTPNSNEGNTREEDGPETDRMIPLDPIDWKAFLTRYDTAVEEIKSAEESTAAELQLLLSFFNVWQQTGVELEEERARKRLRTRVAYATEKEEGLERKREHCEGVRQKFEEAMALLG